MVEEHIQQARNIHQQLDSFEAWSLQQAADLRAKAEVAEEMSDEGVETFDSIPAPAEELREAANEIETVHRRIRGDRPWPM